MSEKRKIRPSDILVIFFIPSGGIRPDGTLDPRTKARCDKAVSEYAQVSPDYIFCSGDCHRNELVANIMAKYLVRQGLPSTHIKIDIAAWDTWENVERVSRFIRRLILKKQPLLIILYVFSQTKHLRRIAYLLNRHGFAQKGQVEIKLIEVQGKESFLETLKFWLTVLDPYGVSPFVRFERWRRGNRAFR